MHISFSFSFLPITLAPRAPVDQTSGPSPLSRRIGIFIPTDALVSNPIECHGQTGTTLSCKALAKIGALDDARELLGTEDMKDIREGARKDRS